MHIESNKRINALHRSNIHAIHLIHRNNKAIKNLKKDYQKKHVRKYSNRMCKIVTNVINSILRVHYCYCDLRVQNASNICSYINIIMSHIDGGGSLIATFYPKDTFVEIHNNQIFYSITVKPSRFYLAKHSLNLYHTFSLVGTLVIEPK